MPTRTVWTTTASSITKWDVTASDASVVTISGTGTDVVSIDWGSFSWFTVTRQANGSVVFTDIHATGHEIIVSNVATVQFGSTLYNVATGATSTAPGLAITASSAVKADSTSGTVPFTFTVTRSGNTAIASSATWTVTGSGTSPAVAADFAGGVLPSGTVSFAAGQTSQTITINVAANAVLQASQGFTVTLTNTLGAVINTASAGGTILPVPSATALSIAAASASNADSTSGTVPFTFTVTRSGNTAIASSATWTVTGSGTSPAVTADFAGGVLPSGTVSFAAGQTSQTITINVAANTVLQASQGFTVSLSKPSSGTSIATASATGTILPAPAATLAIAALSASNADSTSGTVPFTFTVTRSGNTAIASSATWTVTGSGTSPAVAADFAGGVLPSGTVSFAAGQTSQTITINVAANAVLQASQGFTVALSTPSSGTSIATASAAGTILPVPAGTSQPTVWVVNSTDAAVVTINGTGQDIVEINWGDYSWFTITPESNGSVMFQDTHASGHEIIVSNVATVEFDNGTVLYNVATGTWSNVPAPASTTTTTTTTPATIIATPSVPQPSGAGQVVGLVLQNPGTTALAAREITFGQEFSDGQVPAGEGLVATINGQQVAVQMDVKTTYADGSVQMGIVTLAQPALAAGASANVMLALATPSSAPAVSISQLTSGSYNFTVGLTLHNADGSTTPMQFNAATLLAAAVKAGTVSTWLSGPQVTQVSFSTPVTSSMYLTFNISLYADGTTCTEVQFNNDIAMSASGGTLTYDVNIAQNGSTVLQQNNVTQYQYTSWEQKVWSNGAPGVNIQHDVAAFERSGLVQNYDTSTGVSSSLLASEANLLGGAGYGILGPASITQYMPTTGFRPDIGPMPQWSAAALLTQNAGAEQFALAQANASGSVPWNFIDPATGLPITLTKYPTLWTSSLAGPQYGGIPLTQPVPSPATTGWTTDEAHAPDLCYLQYLQTGDPYYLNELNAEASAIPLSYNPGYTGNGQGLFAENEQLRGIAWDLRTLVEAAIANPVGSSERAYFTQLVNNNLNYLLAFTKTANEGQLSGWFSGINGDASATTPWQQNYLATSLALAAENGFTVAKQLLVWQSNFITGQFLNGNNGFSPWDGADYGLTVINSATGQNYQTWAQVWQASQAAGYTNPNPGVSFSDNGYALLAHAALADIITVTGSPQAIQAFGWLSANPGTTNFTAAYQADPTYNIAPRLSDGNLLLQSQIFIRNDSTTTVVNGTSADELIYETGTGNVTINATNGVNILFGGAGVTTLNGGSGDDFLYAGTGTTTLYGAAGNNYMQSGCPTAYTAGATTFELKPSDVATDMIAGFRIGTDHLQVVGDAPGSAALSALIAGATADASGNAVLHLSATHTVTLQGIATSSLSASMFS